MLGSENNSINCSMKSFMGWLKEISNYCRPISLINMSFYVLIFCLFTVMTYFIYAVFYLDGKGHATSYIAILASLVAITTLTYNARRHISEDYSKEAKEYFKRAYETLVPKDGADLPPNDRMSWLTAARFLSIAERMGGEIIMSSHKEAYVEEKHFWRWKFVELIKNFPVDYYSLSPKKFIFWTPGDREPISEYSIYVIHKFIEWEDNYKDPLKTKRFSDEEIDSLGRKGFSNLQDFLLEVKKLKSPK